MMSVNGQAGPSSHQVHASNAKERATHKLSAGGNLEMETSSRKKRMNHQLVEKMKGAMDGSWPPTGLYPLTFL